MDDGSPHRQHCCGSFSTMRGCILVREKQHAGISAALNVALSACAANGSHYSIMMTCSNRIRFFGAELLHKIATLICFIPMKTSLTEHGLDAPLLKPDWSPEFFCPNDYLGHLTFVRASLRRSSSIVSVLNSMAHRITIFCFRCIERRKNPAYSAGALSLAANARIDRAQHSAQTGRARSRAQRHSSNISTRRIEGACDR